MQSKYQKFYEHFYQSGDSQKLSDFLNIKETIHTREISWESGLTMKFKSRFRNWQQLGVEYRLAMSQPVKTRIDIGGIHKFALDHTCMRDNPVIQKELIFDLDLSDYNNLRTCGCVESNACCKLCWPIAACAMNFMMHIFKNDFAFEDVHFFFSGRRGFHCWVKDKSVLDISPSERSSILRYLMWGVDLEKNAPMHPNFNEPFNKYIAPTFQLLMKDHDMWKHAKDYIGDDVKIDQGVHNTEFMNNWFLGQAGVNRIHKVMLKALLPRLDAQVTIQLGHLIRAPYTLHEGTGKQVVPILGNPENFDPESQKSWLY